MIPKKSRWQTEAIAGITTFFTMAYIVVVNPSILSAPGTEMPFDGVLTATVVLAFLMTLLMGLYARLPFAVAPGMGINAFFTYSVIIGKQVPWQTALGMVFWAGILFILLSVTPVRLSVAQAIPRSLRTAAAVGIGLFLTLIGLKNAGIVVADAVTLVKLGNLDRKVLLSLIGLVLMILMMRKKSPFAFLSGIIVVTALGAAMGLAKLPERLTSPPDFTSVMLQADLLGALKLAYLPAIVSFFFTDLFDSISTFIGVAQATGLTDAQGNPKRLKEGLIVDAFATMSAGLLGTSSGTAYIESSAGIEAGGRTGMTAVFTALCFLPCLFLGPLAAMVPAYATAPVLVLVGALMFRSVSELKLERLEEMIPAFLTVVLIPLTFSITQGILWGFVSHVLLFTLAGRRKEVPVMMTAIALVSVGLLAADQF